MSPDEHPALSQGFIGRFVEIQDADYDDIRRLYEVCRQAAFLSIR